MFVITASAENVLTALQRIASLLTRQRLRTAQIYLVEKGCNELAQLRLTLVADQTAVERLVKQLKKMPDLVNVRMVGELQFFTRSIMDERDSRLGPLSIRSMRSMRSIVHYPS